MSRKKFDKELIKDNHGPMNSVSKDDALVWAGAPDVKDLKKLQPGLRRGVLAKIKKAENSSKKADRNISKQIKRKYEEE
jgi:hypothetical protein